MKVINKSFAIILSFLFSGSFIYAQSVGSADTDTITVSATIGQGTSTISIIQNEINFQGGSALIPTDSNTRFISEAVTIRYFAANGPWEIRVYTQNADDKQGLVSTTTTSQVTLKVTPEDKNGNFGDVTLDADWSGDDAELKFFTVLDDDTSDGQGGIFYAIAASSENENPNKDESFQVKFGIDVAGAAPGDYSAEVTFDLAIL